MYRIVLLAATLLITGCSRLHPFKPGSEMFLTQKAATRLHEEFSSVRISPGTKVRVIDHLNYSSNIIHVLVLEGACAGQDFTLYTDDVFSP